MTKIVGGDFFLEGGWEKEVLRKQIWKGSDWEGLMCIRDLRRDVFGLASAFSSDSKRR